MKSPNKKEGLNKSPVYKSTELKGVVSKYIEDFEVRFLDKVEDSLLMELFMGLMEAVEKKREDSIDDAEWERFKKNPVLDTFMDWFRRGISKHTLALLGLVALFTSACGESDGSLPSDNQAKANYTTYSQGLEAPSTDDQKIEIGGVGLRTEGGPQSFNGMDVKREGYSIIENGDQIYLITKYDPGAGESYKEESSICDKNNFQSCLSTDKNAVDNPHADPTANTEMVQNSDGDIFQVLYDSQDNPYLGKINITESGGELTVDAINEPCPGQDSGPIGNAGATLDGKINYDMGESNILEFDPNTCTSGPTQIPSENGPYTEIEPGKYIGGVKHINGQVYLAVSTSPDAFKDYEGDQLSDLENHLSSNGGYLLKTLNANGDPVAVQMRAPKIHIDYEDDGRIKGAWIIGYQEGVGPVSVKLSNYVGNNQCDEGEAYVTGETACTPENPDPDSDTSDVSDDDGFNPEDIQNDVALEDTSDTSDTELIDAVDATETISDIEDVEVHDADIDSSETDISTDVADAIDVVSDIEYVEIHDEDTAEVFNDTTVEMLDEGIDTKSGSKGGEEGSCSLVSTRQSTNSKRGLLGLITIGFIGLARFGRRIKGKIIGNRGENKKK